MWRTNWQVTDQEKPRSGGQGTVRKVVSLQDGRLVGALKEMHPQHMSSTERRFRFQQEVNALLALEGGGVPHVLAHNAEQWRNKPVPLFMVMEWIEGPTLAMMGQWKLDDALPSTLAILRTVSRCQALGILHRDLKPDNIIHKNSDVSSPTLVDFGMSWSKSAVDASFNTPDGQELGNRFLRLPEFAPGHDHHDFRSDISLVVGVLFYMLTGRAPRILHDSVGKLPHERHLEDFPNDIQSDFRWPAVRRIFRIGFQPLLDARFQSPEALVSRIEMMADRPQDHNEEEFLREKAALDDLLATEAWRRSDEAAKALSAGASAFVTIFSERINSAGLVFGGGGPNLTDGGRGNQFYFYIVRQGTSDPQALFRHEMRVVDNQVTARVQLEQGDWDNYYTSHSSDVEGLEAATSSKANSVATALVRILRNKLES